MVIIIQSVMFTNPTHMSRTTLISSHINMSSLVLFQASMLELIAFSKLLLWGFFIAVWELYYLMCNIFFTEKRAKSKEKKKEIK